MKITAEKIAKGKSRVWVQADNGTTIGSVDVSKSTGVAIKYLEETIGAKHDEFMRLCTDCIEYDKANTRPASAGFDESPVESDEASPDVPEAEGDKTEYPSISTRSGITKHVRNAFNEGFTTPTEVFAYLDELGIKYNVNSVYTIVWEERKKANIPALRPHGGRKAQIAETDE